MPPPIHFDFVLIFFIYGLAFFSMGVALTLETGRSPLLVERQFLKPLALFGLLHGAHEWMEVIILQSAWLGLPFPPEISALRVGLLTISFVPLVVFGGLLLDAQLHLRVRPMFIGLAWLSLYLGLLFLSANQDRLLWISRVDALARYLLAIPGGILAGLALHYRAREVKAEDRLALSRNFRWAAWGFILYGMTQLFVSGVDILPGRLVNAQVFMEITGVPVQAIRALMALLITVNLIRAIQFVEREREQQLYAAQQSRLEAMQQVQLEMAEREVLRKELLRHIVIAQEEERSRIARELHDETAQVLTAFTLNLAALKNALPSGSSLLKIADRLQELSRQMSQGIYRLVHDLRPAQLDDLGLVPALEYLVDIVRQRDGLQVTLEVEGQRQRLDSILETVIFRVSQEALINVSRHAETDQADLQLVFLPGKVTLRVCDQGKGFDPGLDLAPPHGWGLAGMKERVESVGGQLNIQSGPGKGTIVEVYVPLAA